MFGSWGGMILQISITLVVVLALIAVVYWLVRRYSSGGLGRIGRGRVPRLAVIDATPVDGRRRLALVRRDNVEHLILIGGPTDVVVEQTIVRPRQRPAAARPQTPSAPPVPATEESPVEPPFVAESTPIPFPQARAQSAAPAYRPEPAPMPPAAAPSYPPATALPIERPFSPIRRAAAQPAPTRPEPAPMAPATPPPPAAPTAVQFEPMAEPEPLFPELPPAPTYEETEATSFGRRVSDMNGAGTHQPEPEREAAPYAAPAPAADDTAAKVNDLEREMARLLGEITAKRT